VKIIPYILFTTKIINEEPVDGFQDYNQKRKKQEYRGGYIDG
jgi:hypothetical protein